MRLKTIISVILLSYVIINCECSENSDVEMRGKKKKKIAIGLVYIADLVLKKFFFLKLAYAFVFWLVIHKAGYFLTWFASYLKEQKHHHHEHPHYDYHPSYSHGPYRKQSYGKI
ncbi:unnamed protein product [Diatraea saccharalis]|uniref:Uncharacterized protein n=1 Tax=Diatraea saccharalis TaxID=40085 RepID=A0A9N9WM21_9NEOP|nr:unnamed protein product [Diatraea saccharalis]